MYVAFNNKEVDSNSNTLRHHFYYVDSKNLNLLYESWVCYKILDEIVSNRTIKFFEVKNQNDSVARFQSEDRSIVIEYQGRYNIEWKENSETKSPEDKQYGKEPLKDVPDIVIRLRNKISIIVDAKYSSLGKSFSYPNRASMQSYLKSVNANYGIFIHANAQSLTWKVISNHKKQKIIWTSLTPMTSPLFNNTRDLQDLTKVTELVYKLKQRRPIKNRL